MTPHLGIWGQENEYTPFFPLPQLGGGQKPHPQHFIGGKHKCLCVLCLSWSSWREARDPKFAFQEQREEGPSDKKGQAPSRLNTEVSDQKLTTRAVSLAATAMCPPPAHTHRDCLTLPGAHIGSPIRILAPWWTWVTPTHAQMQKQLWSQADVPEAIIRTHPQLQALCPSHMWTLVCTHTPVRSRTRPQSPAPKWAWLRSGSRPGKRSGQPVAPQKGIWSPRGSVGLVSPLLPPALPPHHLSLPCTPAALCLADRTPPKGKELGRELASLLPNAFLVPSSRQSTRTSMVGRCSTLPSTPLPGRTLPSVGKA